ncbi:hypothetical protein [Nitrosopumilus ureiphilus]|uniref:hypothetical protein n=1 Tax=Nitrosopumilus ureiphilus TaxID=1470067 RepID=UPI0015C9DFFE|nr:hypothetical protein [Nitrosopumilus ureiphilus]
MVEQRAMKKIATVKLHRFEGKWFLLAFDIAWGNKLENDNFDVYISKNRLHARSQPIIQ